MHLIMCLCQLMCIHFILFITKLVQPYIFKKNKKKLILILIMLFIHRVVNLRAINIDTQIKVTLLSKQPIFFLTTNFNFLIVLTTKNKLLDQYFDGCFYADLGFFFLITMIKYFQCVRTSV